MRRMDCVLHAVRAFNAHAGNPLSARDQDELVHDLHHIVWRKLATFKGQAPFETWIRSFCRLEFLSALRRRARTRRARPLEAAEGTATTPPDPVELEPYIKQLAPMEGRVVLLRTVYDLEFREIARELAISSSTARTHWLRALKKLRDGGHR